MEQYIPKSALVAEIERRIKTNKECMLGLRNLDYYKGKVDALNDTISFLDTLESKDEDLKKEVKNWIESNQDTAGFYNNVEFAKHFYELGIKTAQKGE